MKRLWLAGGALLLLAIAVQFPAAWLAPVMGRATGERWRLGDTAGTVWHGRTTVYAYDRTTGYWYSGRGMEWRVSWRELASGALAARVDFDDGGRAELTAGFRGWTLKSVDARFPAAQLAALLPSSIRDFGWAGTLAVRADAFRCSWRGIPCTGRVDLTWGAAALPQFPGVLLGDYGLRMTAEGDALRFTVTTIRGPLQAAGAGEISRERLQFTGEAYAQGGDARLESMLRAIGRPGSAPGRYLIEYREQSRTR